MTKPVFGLLGCCVCCSLQSSRLPTNDATAGILTPEVRHQGEAVLNKPMDVQKAQRLLQHILDCRQELKESLDSDEQLGNNDADVQAWQVYLDKLGLITESLEKCLSLKYGGANGQPCEDHDALRREATRCRQLFSQLKSPFANLEPFATLNDMKNNYNDKSHQNRNQD